MDLELLGLQLLGLDVGLTDRAAGLSYCLRMKAAKSAPHTSTAYEFLDGKLGLISGASRAAVK